MIIPHQLCIVAVICRVIQFSPSQLFFLNSLSTCQDRMMHTVNAVLRQQKLWKKCYTFCISHDFDSVVAFHLSPSIISVVASLAVSKLGEESLLVDAMIIVRTKCIRVH